MEHVQEPTGGCCVDEDWSYWDQVGGECNSRLRSSGSGESKEGMEAEAQRTGQGRENVTHRRPYHRLG